MSDPIVRAAQAEEPVATTDSPTPAPPPRQPYDLSKFQLDSVLSNATNRKMVCCLGRFTDRGQPEDRALIILEKTAFAEADLVGDKTGGEVVVADGGVAGSDGAAPSGYFSSASRLHELFVNDIYGNFECFPCPDVNRVKTTIIYPATDNHIIKHSTQEVYIFDETPADYAAKTLPYIEAQQFSIDWVFNILEHRSEVERIVFEDPCAVNGFVLLPDLKWDGRTVETLYLLAIVRRRGIRSLRDLSAADLPLLRNIQHSGSQAIARKYGVSERQLRIYLHYQPSFYHLHVHFTYLQHEAPGIRCERGHLLSTVIGNLELLGDYYQRATLPFTVVRQQRLYAIYAGDEKLTKAEEATGESTAKKQALEAASAV